MTNRLKDMLAGTRALEARLAAVFETAARSAVGTGRRQPLEIVESAVDEVARHVLPSGRGRYAFAFNTVRITFVAATPETQAEIEMLCVGSPQLGERVARRLESAGCAATDVEVTHAFAAAADPSWRHPEFHVALSRVDDRPAPQSAATVRIDLLVTHGAADRGAYSFTCTPIAIGRGLEVRDSRHQLLRINHVAFTEGADDVTPSVSRRHARIERDEATGRLRLIDDNSAQGTSIVRGGRGLAVPRGSRGLALQDNDEIVVGEARLRLRLSGE
jgi:hypothetical protein